MRQGKQYVLFAGLLDEAHSRGLKGIDTELVQVPHADNGNTAIVKATVEMEDGRVFGGIGDASPENVGRNIAPHLIRMAETRAKARALRDAVNVGSTALEELSDGDDSPQTPPGPQGRANQGQSRPAQIREAPRNSGASGRPDGGGARKPSRPTPVRNEDAAPEPEEAGSDKGRPPEKAGQKALKSQIDLLKTLITEARGPEGIERMEKHLGKPVTDLTRSEADSWIDRLTPAEERE